jgi:mono/diheme cytochrome c family protein
VKTEPLPKPDNLYALIFAFLLTVSSLGLFCAFAEDVIKEGEVWTAPPRAARKQNPIPAGASTIAQGRELYTAGCLPCHGPAGKGDGPAAATLERNGKPIRPGNLSDPRLWEQTDGVLFWKISEGRTPMPAFQESFSEEQRWQVVNFVRTLAPRAGNKNAVTKSGGQ